MDIVWPAEWRFFDVSVFVGCPFFFKRRYKVGMSGFYEARFNQCKRDCSKIKILFRLARSEINFRANRKIRGERKEEGETPEQVSVNRSLSFFFGFIGES